MSTHRALVRTAAPYVIAVLVAAAAGLAVTRLSGDGGPSAVNRITIAADDYIFLVPDTVPAGITTLELVNRGAELHHAILVRLEEGKTLAELESELREALRAGGQPRPW